MEQLNIISFLEEEVDQLARQDVLRLSSTVEELLPRLWIRSTLAEIQALADRQDVSFADPTADRLSDRFFFDGRWYTVAQFAEGNALNMAVRSVSRIGSRFQKAVSRENLRSMGRFRAVRTRTDQRFESVRELISENGRLIYDQGYQWLNHEAKSNLEKGSTELAADLYTLVRKIVPHGMADKIWFYAIVEGKGVYIADSTIVNEGVTRVHDQELGLPESALELVAELLASRLNAKDTYSHEAITQNKLLVVDLSAAKYADTGLQVAEEAIYESRGLIAHPLVTEGRHALVAGYPTGMLSKIEDPLNAHKHMFLELVNRHSRRLKNVARKLRIYPDHLQIAGDIAWLVGRYQGGKEGVPPRG